MPTTTNYSIKVLEKTFKLLGLFTEQRKALSITEISTLLGYNKSSIFRIIKNLEDVAYLEKDPESQKYKLGFGLYYLGTLAESHTLIRKIAQPLLLRLNEECEETVHLAVMDRGQALYLEKIPSKKVLQVISRVGTKLPCHCSGVGKILLSALPPEDLEQIVLEKGLPRFTPNTITDIQSLLQELECIRKQGYAIDNEEIETGLKCIAGPVRDPLRGVAAAVSISAPKGRFDTAFSTLKALVLKTVDEISTRIANYKEPLANSRTGR